MKYEEFLGKIIERGLEAVGRDYAGQPDRLRGATDGFEACRDKTPEQLLNLLQGARARTHHAFREEKQNYWEVRCFEAEVEWVCNCVSVLMMNSGLPVLVQPTARAAMTVVDIVGVREPGVESLN